MRNEATLLKTALLGGGGNIIIIIIIIIALNPIIVRQWLAFPCNPRYCPTPVPNHKSLDVPPSYTGCRHPPVASTIHAPDGQWKKRITHLQQDTNSQIHTKPKHSRPPRPFMTGDLEPRLAPLPG
ncbi:hypothetical protein ASPBRDRAFT_40127 [Aspergillus brasiliensis CBS 101740]|uniref:Uncharacterized protein n=1 Tax=Aspergillus brasiliensis (strain CBS 101740 / IMI 381727 / IBT 21946) TaxID=767769 RepID=A0A1L9UTF5_ASPBC|nr:hypothetical protein ASPBRDRAFT_40127 [Aspergillus brasiliensis CBS 101740]